MENKVVEQTAGQENLKDKNAPREGEAKAECFLKRGPGASEASLASDTASLTTPEASPDKEIERMLKGAQVSAKQGEVPLVDYWVKSIKEYAGKAGVTLSEERLKELEGYKREARINAIDSLHKSAQSFAQRGEVYLVDSNVKSIKEYAAETGVTLSEERLKELEGYKREARINAINRFNQSARLSAQEGEVHLVDLDARIIYRYAFEAGVELPLEQRKELEILRREARVKGIDIAFENAREAMKEKDLSGLRYWSERIVVWAQEAKIELSEDKRKELEQFQASLKQNQ